VALVGPFVPSLAASELAKLRGEPLPDGLPELALGAVIAAQAAVRDAVRAGACASVHDIAEGGLAVALAECCLEGVLGAEIELDGPTWDASLFGEGSGGFVVSGGEDALRALSELTPVRMIGTVGGDALRISLSGGTTLSATLTELKEAHGALAELFG